MARPNKIGLDYFPLDVDFFEDEKILAISGEFAVKGEIISLRILCEIYRNGYFVEYSELLKNKLARLGGLSGGLVDEVVSKLVKYGFFEESLFREFNILTSKGIQKRFIEASKRRKNDLCIQYSLLNRINVYNNPPPKDINAYINTQSKVNESKVKENKIKEIFDFLNFDFCDEHWKQIIIRWFDYVIENKPEFKVVQSKIESFHRDMQMNSDRDIDKANQIIDYTISNGWRSIQIPERLKFKQQASSETTKGEYYRKASDRIKPHVAEFTDAELGRKCR